MSGHVFFRMKHQRWIFLTFFEYLRRCNSEKHWKFMYVLYIFVNLLRISPNCWHAEAALEMSGKGPATAFDGASQWGGVETTERAGAKVREIWFRGPISRSWCEEWYCNFTPELWWFCWNMERYCALNFAVANFDIRTFWKTLICLPFPVIWHFHWFEIVRWEASKVAWCEEMRFSTKCSGRVSCQGEQLLRAITQQSKKGQLHIGPPPNIVITSHTSKKSYQGINRSSDHSWNAAAVH